MVIVCGVLTPLLNDCLEGDPKLLRTLLVDCQSVILIDQIFVSGLDKRQSRWLENRLSNQFYFIEDRVGAMITLVDKFDRRLICEFKALIVA